jgi:hypothetical protein
LSVNAWRNVVEAATYPSSDWFEECQSDADFWNPIWAFLAQASAVKEFCGSA